MKNFLLIGLFTLITISSCELIEDASDELNQTNIAAGLKEALKVGTDTATSKLAITDGYFKDAAVKILLPTDLQNQIADFKAFEINLFGFGTVTGEQIYNSGIPALGINSLKSKEDDLILGINRAAETAASEAGPIFFSAITDITIADAEGILRGNDSAATNYLRGKTFDALFLSFEPKINSAINNVKIGELSVEERFANFAVEYNKILNTSVPTGLISTATVGELANLNTIAQPDISTFATDRGLKGLFIKIKEEEKNIRENPLARVTELLKEVFGLLDK